MAPHQVTQIAITGDDGADDVAVGSQAGDARQSLGRAQLRQQLLQLNRLRVIGVAIVQRRGDPSCR